MLIIFPNTQNIIHAKNNNLKEWVNVVKFNVIKFIRLVLYFNFLYFLSVIKCFENPVIAPGLPAGVLFELGTVCTQPIDL